MELTLLFAVLTGVAFLWLATRVSRRRLAGIDHLVDSVLAAAVTGMVAGRLAAMIFTGTNPITHPLDVVIVRGGVDTRVAAVTAVAALAWGFRPSVPARLDAVAPAALAGLAGWHAGCLWRGACLGTASDLPWSVALPGSDVTRHPVEVYASILLLVAAVGVSRLPARPWLATGAAVAGAGLARLVTQPLRPSLGGGPVLFYALAAFVGLIVVVAAVRGWMPRAGAPSDADHHPAT